ncbi:hypothetical protein Aph02nite_22150 [Actinoplanes philippinensis]|uniref:Uncharacterized protein n=1 Tax=Actinoplanes philippinensis TaxID=35752 RepID=A0A1I2C2W8_9ACTN|nr:hypothetical protein [Actinoplanes philippinensis]GIE76265.1 hypothetical protein Aph02nite_22150 [Actinoplanes philippinensis]SFE62679.1 hypothetical protein SAMN05421541_102684 [Actinoplanes philippinensis]
MTAIENLLQRRTDLSTFLVHLTRDGMQGNARDNLLAMAEDKFIEARNPFGPASKYEPLLADSVSQKAVCFTETPLEHTWMMLEKINGRGVQFEPYGLVITRATARKTGCNPVWYTDITVRGRTWPAKNINLMIDNALRRATVEDGRIDRTLLAADPVFQITPYFEQMGPISNGRRKEFWWEREWRHIGGYWISIPRIVAILAPADEHGDLRDRLSDIDEAWERRPLLDPRWGLERAITALADVSRGDATPFPDPD